MGRNSVQESRGRVGRARSESFVLPYRVPNPNRKADRRTWIRIARGQPVRCSDWQARGKDHARACGNLPWWVEPLETIREVTKREPYPGRRATQARQAYLFQARESKHRAEGAPTERPPARRPRTPERLRRRAAIEGV